jgi:hypothetical protein
VLDQPALVELLAVGQHVLGERHAHRAADVAGLNFGFFVWSRVYIGIGLPMIFLSITAASYEGIRKDQTDQASALINVARNVGGSMGVSLAQNVRTCWPIHAMACPWASTAEAPRVAKKSVTVRRV